MTTPIMKMKRSKRRRRIQGHHNSNIHRSSYEGRLYGAFDGSKLRFRG